ncbi:hypothetical protein B0H65DRAFT_476991 [Neurospora tetraspora]|uniref:BTB domain-containing protein n=1 Tax=Neurospora tetraspora TaxID=94610 RepID=A0AAE0MMA3_9PEZI|nr:hypothetical protein B0H65DRAFT_476991 [Neurospora tetraspora]
MDTPITINIDPEGDLFLDATADPSNRKRFRVCSQALRRKSPVWKRMLFGPWKESKPANDKEWVVELPDDPVRPLQIILSIIHSNFDAVPGFTSIEIIHQVLIMTNKYDITSIVRPWSLQWLQIAELPSNAAAEVVKSLYIAWELGSEEVFASKLEHISLHTELDSKGRLFFDSAILLEEEEFLGPQTALDTISKIRLDLLQKLISPVHEVLDARTKQQPFCPQNNPYNPGATKACDAAVLGNIYREMVQARGAVLSEFAADINDSVVNLAAWIFSFMAKIEGIHQGPFGTAAPCAPKSKFQDLNKSIHDSIPAVVAGFMEPGYKEYMAKQRSKTGVALPPPWENHTTKRHWD